ncbi:PhzF family phenazine biosynthesis protein [Paenibacillus sp. NEAU-GSW1]|uniref:PhzF family phenazine biosynthesis protein n=1 Tax=Paenibacillus sp. NEAU-GSW1 TaxID=2682486 RepID=UPI00139D4381|nr:PhzF family phenazine biosynthesis isomerase [Paenibacillus sp. NEAU-GSW1]
MTTIPICIVDAFTDKPFKGNPAAVCLLEKPMDAQWMQQVAAEMNLSETAFVEPAEEGYGLRWFTPLAEVDLCGHATLAAACTLWQTGKLSKEKEALFQTKSGLLTVRRADEQEGDWMTMDFPAEPSVAGQAPEALIQGLGLIPRYTGKNRMDYLVEVDSERTVRELQPDWTLLRTLEGRGVIVTAKADAGQSYEFVSRAFYPKLGVNEDPVTGSAHCALAPYWSKRLRKESLTGFQASARGGLVRTELKGERVLLGGQAVMVVRGQLEHAAVEGGNVNDEA